MRKGGCDRTQGKTDVSQQKSSQSHITFSVIRLCACGRCICYWTRKWLCSFSNHQCTRLVPFFFKEAHASFFLKKHETLDAILGKYIHFYLLVIEQLAKATYSIDLLTLLILFRLNHCLPSTRLRGKAYVAVHVVFILDMLCKCCDAM